MRSGRRKVRAWPMAEASCVGATTVTLAERLQRVGQRVNPRRVTPSSLVTRMTGIGTFDHTRTPAYNARMDWWMWFAGGLALMVRGTGHAERLLHHVLRPRRADGRRPARLGLSRRGWAQWLLFTVASLGYLLLFRGKLQDASRRPRRPTSIPWSASWPCRRARSSPARSAASKCAARRGARATSAADAIDHRPALPVVVSDGLLLTVRPE